MKKYKVLVVDDSSVIREVVIDILKEEISLEYVEAADGNEAVARYKEYKPDLVTMDINMPNLDGIGALKQIIDFDRKAKVVMLTTESEKQKIVESISHGAKNYITKPIDKDIAIAKLKIALDI